MKTKSMSRREQGEKTETTPQNIYCDGSGSRPDGKNAGFAWINQTTGSQNVERRDGLTNNEAEYLAVKAALESLKPGTSANLFSDSDVIVRQFQGRYKVREPRLQKLLAEIRDVIESRDLHVELNWVQRELNPAGRLL